MEKQGPIDWAKGYTPHHQSEIYDCESGETLALCYNDEGARFAKRLCELWNASIQTEPKEV